jgi:hypothetical protein
MTGLFDFVWDALAALMANPAVLMAFQLAAVYLVILWLASSYWVYRDLGRRTRDPISPFLAASAVILFTPLLFPLALVAYRIARPQDTLAEKRVGQLQQVVLELEADRDSCPRCASSIEPAWVRCPTCRTSLAAMCADCDNPMGLDWTVCAWCAADVPWAVDEVLEPALEPAARPGQADEPRPWAAPRRVRPALAAAGTRLDGLLDRIGASDVMQRLDEAFASVSTRSLAARVPGPGLAPALDEQDGGQGTVPAGDDRAVTMRMVAAEPLPELGLAVPLRGGRADGVPGLDRDFTPDDHNGVNGSNGSGSEPQHLELDRTGASDEQEAPADEDGVAAVRGSAERADGADGADRGTGAGYGSRAADRRRQSRREARPRVYRRG